jgi:hypothetical protein
MCFGERTSCCSNRNCCSDEDEAELAERAQTSPSALPAQPQRAGRDAAPRAGGPQSPPLRQERVKHFPEPVGKRPGSEAPAGLAASTGAEEASGRAPAPAMPADPVEPADDEYAHALRSSRVASLAGGAGGAGGAMVQDESSLSSPRASSKGRTEGLPPFLASPRGRPVHSPRVPPLAIGEVVAHSDTDAFSERSFGEDLGIAFPFGLGAKGEAEGDAALAKEYRDRLQKYRDQLRTKARHRLCPPLPARRPPRPPPALLVAAR